MKRFDKAIRALENEKLKIVGKAALEFADKGFVQLSIKTVNVKNINEAIEILKEHHRNVSI